MTCFKSNVGEDSSGVKHRKHHHHHRRMITSVITVQHQKDSQHSEQNDSSRSFSSHWDAVTPRSKLLESIEREMEEGRAWGGRERELICVRQQLQLCSIGCEEEPLSLTVNALLYTHDPSAYSLAVTGNPTVNTQREGGKSTQQTQEQGFVIGNQISRTLFTHQLELSSAVVSVLDAFVSP